MSTVLQKLGQYRAKKCRAALSEFKFEKSNRILEVGSGVGDEISWCIKAGSYFTAVEISSEKCKIIGEKLRQKSKYAHVDIVRADGTHLPFKNDIFDIVFCKAVLHHLQVPSQAVGEMGRVSRNGGIVLAINEPNALNPLWHIAAFGTKNRWFKRIFSSLLPGYAHEWDIWAKPFYSWQLSFFFKRAGLNQIRVGNILLPYFVESVFLFNMYFLLAKSLEKTPFSYVFGQLFAVGVK